LEILCGQALNRSLSVSDSDKDGDLRKYPALNINDNQPRSTGLGQGAGDPANDEQGN
jgi:hypothetical protein